MKVGTVYLVGAGPGDPGLLTLRAAELLEAAEVVAHDALIPQPILRLVPEAAVRVAVGRRCGAGQTGYRLHPEILRHALAGRDVVRLKAGDPLIFGRGGEEAEELRRANVPLQIVPGISAASGAAAYAGIPLTHRDHASHVVFGTGHDVEVASENKNSWPALVADGGVADGGTLVLFMAAQKVRANVQRLLAAGRDARTPAACIACATWPQQQVVVATLADLAERMAAAAIRVPALIIVGEVVTVRERITWLSRCPLLGRCILLGLAHGRAAVAAQLRRAGARVVEAPPHLAIALASGPQAQRFDLAVLPRAFVGAIPEGSRDMALPIIVVDTDEPGAGEGVAAAVVASVAQRGGMR